MDWSLPARGAWIEIIAFIAFSRSMYCRSPHGERGLKCVIYQEQEALFLRRSPHGERGLKFVIYGQSIIHSCRSPHGERGLKYNGYAAPLLRCTRRSPHGERGLKYHKGVLAHGRHGSPPARGAWIEIFFLVQRRPRPVPSPPARGAWIEIISSATNP